MEFLSQEKRAASIMNTASRGFWNGVAEVIPRAGNDLLQGADGAYVGVIGLANSMAEFMGAVKVALDAMDFDVLEVADTEFIDSIEKWTGADDLLRERAANLSMENPIELGSFHCFRESNP